MKRFFSVCVFFSALLGTVPSYAIPCSQNHITIRCSTSGECMPSATCSYRVIAAHGIDSFSGCFQCSPGQCSVQCAQGCVQRQQFLDVCCDDGSTQTMVVELCCYAT